MKKKYQYVNSALIKATASLLSAYKDAHPDYESPLIRYCAEHKIAKNDRVRFVRAAQQLGWNVIRTDGKVYDNGRFAWSE